jgi:hypothetical protein
LQNADLWQFQLSQLWKSEIAPHDLSLLWFLLYVVGAVEVTDPRDRLFGIIGIIQHPGGYAWYPELVPDYHRSLVDILAKLAKYFIKRTDSLLPLLRAHEVIEGLPSWVPSWGKTASLPFPIRKLGAPPPGGKAEITYSGKWQRAPR